MLAWVIWFCSLKIVLYDNCLVVHKLSEKIELNYRQVGIVKKYNSFMKSSAKYGGSFLLYGSDEILNLDYFSCKVDLIDAIREKRREYILRDPKPDFHTSYNRRVAKSKSLSVNFITSLFAIPALLFIGPVFFRDIKSGKLDFNLLLFTGVYILIVFYVLAAKKRKMEGQEKKRWKIVSEQTDDYSGDLSTYKDIHIVEAYDYFYYNPDDKRGARIFSELKKRGLADENDFIDNDELFVMKDGYSNWDNIKAERIKLAKRFIYIPPSYSDLFLSFYSHRKIIRTSDIISAKKVKEFDVAKLRYEDALKIRFTAKKKRNYILISAKNLDGWIPVFEKAGVPVSRP